MIRRMGLPLFQYAAALLLMVAGVLSAAHTAPDKSEPSRQAFVLATGGSYADICADSMGEAGVHCPFCHLTAAPPPCGVPDRQIALWFGEVDRPSGDLVLGPQHIGRHVSARAPPRRA